MTRSLVSAILILVLIFMVAYYTKKFANPYKLIMVFGKKGSGKTTLLTRLALKELKKGWTVYSTVDVPGCITFDVNRVGDYAFPPESVIFIDEVGMVWDNRNYKNFKSSVRDYFKLQRHYKNKVYLFSQTFDVDVKLRNLTDAMYLCTCHFGFISIARKIKRDIMIVEATGESESRIADSLEFVPIWLSLFGAGSVIITFIPKYARYFDSHYTPAKPFVLGAPLPVLQVPKLRDRFRMFLDKLRKLLRDKFNRLNFRKKKHKFDIVDFDDIDNEDDRYLY